MSYKVNRVAKFELEKKFFSVLLKSSVYIYIYIYIYIYLVNPLNYKILFSIYIRDVT